MVSFLPGQSINVIPIKIMILKKKNNLILALIWAASCGYSVAIKCRENRGRVGDEPGGPAMVLRKKTGSGFGIQDLAGGGRDSETG